MAGDISRKCTTTLLCNVFVVIFWRQSMGGCHDLSDRYWPIRVAFDAYLHGEARLMDVNPEVRSAAKRIFDWLDAPRRIAGSQTDKSKPRRQRSPQ